MPGALHLEHFGAGRFAEMALAGGHLAVDVLGTRAALAREMRADALYLVALDL